MTEQQACTLCGADGHTAARCNWNKNSAKIAVASLRAGLRALSDYIGPKCRNAVEEAMATTSLDHFAPQPVPAEGVRVHDEVFEAEFMTWWEDDGQFCRSGGGDYERTFAFQAWRHLYPQLIQARAALAQLSPVPELDEVAALQAQPIGGKEDGE
ncbi:hypothetical protein A6723_019460 [Pseudomonas sp. AU11447]|uniref:hypothetical protein n=1 Tax=unclassified Pseudomonas TaxID=196821 RepID=UPI0006D4828F|nr:MULTISPECIES: hypothetical protein [unclassified Pseudomonas]OBY90490.1 hypothetical protein A6723_019460 [Pseudomonas sp. AU11447]